MQSFASLLLFCSLRPRHFALLVLSLLLLLRPGALLAQDCCTLPACQAQARTYGYRLAAQLKPLGKCPENKADRDAALARYQAQEPVAYASLTALVQELKAWATAEPSRNLCLAQTLNELDGSQVDVMSVLNWTLHLAEALPVARQQSPEFCQGFAATIELNQGAADIFSRSESYFLSAQAFFLLKTLGAGRGQCGGRVRLWLGGGLNYLDRNAKGVLAGKLEYRLQDLEAANLATLGHLKAILEPGYAFGPSSFQVLAGLGADVHLLQVQALGGYQARENRYLFSLGLVYALTRH